MNLNSLQFSLDLIVFPFALSPDLSGFRSEFRNSTSFDHVLIISAHPELAEGHERLFINLPRTALVDYSYPRCFAHKSGLQHDM